MTIMASTPLANHAMDVDRARFMPFEFLQTNSSPAYCTPCIFTVHMCILSASALFARLEAVGTQALVRHQSTCNRQLRLGPRS